MHGESYSIAYSTMPQVIIITILSSSKINVMMNTTSFDHSHVLLLFLHISDFGLLRDLANESYYVSHGGKMIKIPLKWTAPEAFDYKRYSSASDVWSYSYVCLLYEIWSVGHKPFQELTTSDVSNVYMYYYYYYIIIITILTYVMRNAGHYDYL